MISKGNRGGRRSRANSRGVIVGESVLRDGEHDVTQVSARLEALMRTCDIRERQPFVDVVFQGSRFEEPRQRISRVSDVPVAN